MSSLPKIALSSAINTALSIPLQEKEGQAVIHVTPEIAAQWLTYNQGNRARVAKKVEQFKADMERGQWRDAFDPIRFAKGKLLDGQHRLEALMLANVKLRMLVAWGLDPETQVVMDTGRVRSPSDILSIEGLGTWEARIVGAAVHPILSYMRGGFLYSTSRFTNHEVRDFFLEHRGKLERSLRCIKDTPRWHPILAHSRAIALHFVFSEVAGADLADQFFSGLLTGEGLTKTSPIFQLRAVLTNDALASRTRSAYETYLFVVRGWNAWRHKSVFKTAKNLTQRADGKFPEISA